MRRVSSLLFFLLVLVSVSPVQAEEPVHFSDPHLKAAVAEELWVSDPTPTDMLALTSLTCIDDGISDLTGLEHATNLQSLYLRRNPLSDISVLSGLEELEWLNLSYNEISDISALSGLEKLEYLNLHKNHISSISALSGLINLETVDLHTNEISDLSPLSGLVNLTHLYLYENEIRYTDGLSGLINLTELRLYNNPLREIYALSDLENLEVLDLQSTELQSVSGLSGLSNLDTLALQYSPVSDISSLSYLANLECLYLYGTQVSDISALSALTHLTYVDMRWSPLDEEAYCSHLWTLAGNNPGMALEYSPNCRPPARVRIVDNLSPDRLKLAWNEVCAGPECVSYYRVYRARSQSGVKTPISDWQTACCFEDTTVAPGCEYYYWVQTATSDNGSQGGGYGEPVAGLCAPSYALALSSTAGGEATAPGEGVHVYDAETTVDIAAVPLESAPYFFVAWAGTAVHAGAVANPKASLTSVTVDKAYDLTARFMTTMDTLYVDDDGPNDPGPGNVSLSDPQENGTAFHPFDRVQEALDVAPEGACVLVHSGMYSENIHFRGRNVRLTGMTSDDSFGVGYPVLEAGGEGPVVSFTEDEDPNCMLTGFVITRGQDEQAGAILCSASSPTVANCLIVGNRTDDPNGAAISCTDSHAVFINCTIADNPGGGFQAVDSDIMVVNSIVWGNGPAEIVITGDGTPQISYSDALGAWPGQGNIATDPRFTRRGCWVDQDDPSVVLGPTEERAVWVDGDYHLTSRAGRWDGQAQSWVKDGVASSCIDAGDPVDSVGSEPTPNGGVVNMGAYGGMHEASKSL